MSSYNPSSDDILFALEALGFDVTDENDEYTVVSDGSYTLKVYHDPDDEEIKKLRSGLADIFSDYEDRVQALTEADEDEADEDDIDDEEFDTDSDFDYADELRRVRMWLDRSS